MRTKRKMALAISAFVMLILAGVISVVAVLAAQNVAVKSNVTIKYSSVEFKGSVKAEYKVHGAAAYSLVGADESKSTASFTGEEDDGAEKTITGNPVINLTKSHPSVEFKFTFSKGQTADAATYVATLGSLTPPTNFTIEYTGFTNDTAKTVTLGSTSTQVTIKYTLTSFTDDVTINPEFNWTIAIS